MIKFFISNRNQNSTKKITLKNLFLNIKDKKIIDKNNHEDIDIKIERRLNQKNKNKNQMKEDVEIKQTRENQGTVLKYNGEPFEYNILIYINNLK